MAALVPAGAEDVLLAGIIGSWLNLAAIQLYMNDYTPDDTTVYSNLTEADFNGYTAGGIVLPGASGAFQNGDNKAEIGYDEVSWTKGVGGTGDTIYGYMIVDAVGNLVAVERFATPVDMNTDGSILNLDVAVTLSQDPPS